MGKRDVTGARSEPWGVIESRLVDIGYTPYWSGRDEQAVGSIDCCRCKTELKYVGMEFQGRRFAFGVCVVCAHWLHFEGSNDSGVPGGS